jgi:hypothetical protein
MAEMRNPGKIKRNKKQKSKKKQKKKKVHALGGSAARNENSGETKTTAASRRVFQGVGGHRGSTRRDWEGSEKG